MPDWFMRVDSKDDGGTFSAHLTGAANDASTHPVPAGTMHFRIRDSQVQKFTEDKSYRVNVVEVPAGDFPKVAAPMRFWVFIADSSAVGINGEDRMGPHEPQAPSNIMGDLVIQFRDQSVFQALRAGIVYQFTFS
jgi:hypothetical protein